jgi:hypothetical protein
MRVLKQENRFPLFAQNGHQQNATQECAEVVQVLGGLLHS